MSSAAVVFEARGATPPPPERALPPALGLLALHLERVAERLVAEALGEVERGGGGDGKQAGCGRPGGAQGGPSAAAP